MGKLIGSIGGLAAGAALSGLAGVKLMQTKMTVSIKSPKSFEETCEGIEKSIEEFKDEGWGFPFDKWDFHNVLENSNLVPEGIEKIMVYFLCNARLASKVISVNNSMMGIMPCSWAVYQKQNSVYIAKMNIGLMSKMFTGEIKEMMLEVEKTEKRMLDKIFS